MKTVGTIFLLVGLSLGAWGENLALTIEYDIGDLGEEHDTWTARYYTDDRGRLCRMERVIRGPFIGDPDTTETTTINWVDTGVSWNWWSGDLFAARTPEGYIVKAGKDTETIRYGEDADGFYWTDERWTYRWTPRLGYQAVSASGRKYWTTTGARLIWWSNGHENETVILDRTPTEIIGRYIQILESGTESEVKGEVRVSGIGLWHSDPHIRLLHAYFLQTNLSLAWSAPLVWTQGYLK